MTFYWFDDALAHATEQANLTGIRHRVFRTAGGWTVELAEMAVLTQELS